MDSAIKIKIIQAAVVMVGLLFAVKLMHIQVFDDVYKRKAENNVLRKVTEYPYRGVILDRNNNYLVYNEPVYDLMIIPKDVEIADTLSFCSLLDMEKEEFVQRYKKCRKYSGTRPSVFQKQLTNPELARLQSHLIDYPGFYLKSRSMRGYPHKCLSHVLGYIGEVSLKELKNDKTGYYKSRDYIGKSGLEKQYEEKLRGTRGSSAKLVNVRGEVKGKFGNGKYDTLPIPGSQLKISIDLKLQQYGERLLRDKRASLVALEPSTGDVLAYISAPNYDPTLFTGRNFSKNYSKLENDEDKPLLNRVNSTYPPGSTFKMVQSLIGLQEGVIRGNETIYCDNSIVGDHAPPGSYTVTKAIRYSSNNFFVKLYKRILEQKADANQFKDAAIGMKKWTRYIHSFGLGKKLGIDIPFDKKGLIPSVAYYDRIIGKYQWKASRIRSVGFGQGELLVTTLQLANMTAAIANRGYYITPHFVKEIDGEPVRSFEKHKTLVNHMYFEPVIEGMAQAISQTASRAYMKDIEICGKTGTAQNPHGKDHSVFVAFAPRNNPKIAIAVYVENADWGGGAAAVTASLMIEKYLKGEVKRAWLEDYLDRKGYLRKESY
ncbi:MAG: penicillin-binding protein 2 [Cytophagales bacterium]|nr:penicillin-binding protein 2 [Cytophagales bacterium]